MGPGDALGVEDSRVKQCLYSRLILESRGGANIVDGSHNETTEREKISKYGK